MVWLHDRRTTKRTTPYINYTFKLICIFNILHFALCFILVIYYLLNLLFYLWTTNIQQVGGRHIDFLLYLLFAVRSLFLTRWSFFISHTPPKIKSIWLAFFSKNNKSVKLRLAASTGALEISVTFFYDSLAKRVLRINY